MRSLLAAAAAVTCALTIGCQSAFVVDVKPGAEIRPDDRLAIVDESPREFVEVGAKVADYLTNKFVGMNVQVVERSHVNRVLQEKGLDPSSAPESEIKQAIASATDATLIGFHKIQSYSNVETSSDGRSSSRRLRLAGLFRIVSMQSNVVIVGASGRISASGSDEESSLQEYAGDFYRAVREKLTPRRGLFGSGPTTRPAAQ